ncbi:hypothetical protein [Methylotuvimicrobium sp. KM1]|uniref:hypothetical protein n=1 Tax=Methylotuvimicrobium sp. KM1 TaxID=3377707 RepID=UPI00384D3346
MKKNYRQPQMSENEEEVMGYFERMLTFEFYIRYLEMNRSHDLRRIQRLNKIVTKRFIDFDKTHSLSGIEFKLPSDTQNQPPIPLDIDCLIMWALNKLQSPPISTEDLPKKIDLSALFFPDDVRKFLSTQILPLKKYVKPSQRKLSYRFYDLTHPNGINSVFDWWFNHIDLQSVKKKEVLRDISMKIEEPIKNDDGSHPSYIVRTAPNFSSPSVLLNNDDRYRIYSTNTQTITVDGQELSNATLLSIRFDKDIKDIGEAVDLFRAHLRFDNSNWNSEQIKSESIPSFNLIQRKHNSGLVQLDQSNQYAKIITRYDFIMNYIIGLMCFDEVKNTQKSHNKNVYEDTKIIKKAAETVSKNIYSNKKIIVEFRTVEANYNSIFDKISLIDDIVKLKQNRLKYGEKYEFKNKVPDK